MALLSDEEVGIGLQSDDAVGLKPRKLLSDADVGLAPAAPEGVNPTLAANVTALSAQRTNPPFKVMQEATENVLNAFGQGFREGWGPERLGITPDDAKKLSKIGLFAPEGQTSYNNPFHAFNELLAQTIYTSAEILLRGGSGAFRGAQAAAVEAGAPRDIAALPEAFFGSPHPLGIPKVGEPPMLRVPIREDASPIPPPAEGFTRLYHVSGEGAEGSKTTIEINGVKTTVESGRIMTPDIDLARDAGRDINYIDVPNDSPFLKAATDENRTVEIPEEAARGLKPYEEAIPLSEARGLGVIGPERPSINEGTPEAAAEAVTRNAAEQSLPKTESPPIADDGWQARFDKFVSKIEAPGDVKRLIRDAASENDNFPAARQGDIPLQHVESIAEAAGVEPSEVNAAGLGRTLRNDQQVRIAMRLMIQGTDNVKAMAKEVIADASPENLIKFQEALLRRDMAVEQIVGLRAEWGRTGNVFQEFMREVKDEKALDSFLQDKCPL